MDSQDINWKFLPPIEYEIGEAILAEFLSKIPVEIDN